MTAVDIQAEALLLAIEGTVAPVTFVHDVMFPYVRTHVASFLRANCVDHIALFGAGVAIGSDGLPNLAHLGTTILQDAPRFKLHRLEHMGGDVLSHWEIRSA